MSGFSSRTAARVDGFGAAGRRHFTKSLAPTNHSIDNHFMLWVNPETPNERDRLMGRIVCSRAVLFQGTIVVVVGANIAFSCHGITHGVGISGAGR
jgi:hypothetical protein